MSCHVIIMGTKIKTEAVNRDQDMRRTCGSKIGHQWTKTPTYKNRTHIHHECTICGQVRIKIRLPAWGRAEVTDDGDEPMTAADAKWHRTRDLTKMFAKLERAMT